MTAKMSAYRLLEWEKAPQLVTVDVPKPGPGQVLIRIAGNGLCHSDIGMGLMPASIGELIGWSMPFTLGHEIGGYNQGVGGGAGGTLRQAGHHRAGCRPGVSQLLRNLPVLPPRPRQRVPQRPRRQGLWARRRSGR